MEADIQHQYMQTVADLNHRNINLSECTFSVEQDQVLHSQHIEGMKLFESIRELVAEREQTYFVTTPAQTPEVNIPEDAEVSVVTEVISESFYFVGGIQTVLVEQRLEQRWISTTYNKEYTLISNDDQNIVVDVSKSIGGLISNRIGCYLESDEANELKNHIFDDLNTGKQVNFACFSQGVIIVHNVLGEIKRLHGDDWWNQHSHQITIKYFGNAIRDWPPGMEVTGYLQDGDTVAKMAGGLSRTSTWLKSWFGREYDQARIIVVDGGDHDFYSYIKMQPAFYVQDFIERNGGKMNGGLLANELYASIKESKAYGPDAYTEVVDYCVKVGGREFCTNIRTYLREEDDAVFIENVRIKPDSVRIIQAERIAEK